MRIEHLAIWAIDIEKLRAFYLKYFGAVSNDRYHNPTKNFQSYFLSFGTGCRLELMQKTEIPETKNLGEATGITHIAFSVGSEEAVNSLTETIRSDGYQVVGEPRWTGDGYYESVVLDPEGNRLEITI
ncbi:MAG: hypothetical protein GC192_20655 [Bacteroidetes bacterium]|nr:hypothetical protein [Bacteroidota bacterium]